mmetsp:Transcript_12310/g.28906  ORF Transcript_12310/g.28906 Transcript_12310/m.28906 type:complete len:240 (+) Transcript_12310:1758-2477(+)
MVESSFLALSTARNSRCPPLVPGSPTEPSLTPWDCSFALALFRIRSKRSSSSAATPRLGSDPEASTSNALPPSGPSDDGFTGRTRTTLTVAWVAPTSTTRWTRPVATATSAAAPSPPAPPSALSSALSSAAGGASAAECTRGCFLASTLARASGPSTSTAPFAPFGPSPATAAASKSARRALVPSQGGTARPNLAQLPALLEEAEEEASASVRSLARSIAATASALKPRLPVLSGAPGA